MRRPRSGQARDVRGNQSQLVNQGLQAGRIQGGFEEENQQVQPDQEISHKGCAEAGLIVADRYHEGFGSLVNGFVCELKN
jgi:hypothetical protein